MVKYSTILKILVVLILLSNIMFFSLPVISSVMQPICDFSDKKLLIVLILVMTLFVICQRIKLFDFKYNSSKAALIYVFMYFIAFAYSIVCYSGVTVKTIAGYYFYPLAILFFFALKSFIKSEKNYYWFVNTIIIIGAIYSAYMIIAKILATYTGVFIVNIEIQRVQQRIGQLRFARPANFISISALFAWSMFIKGLNDSHFSKRKYFLLFVLQITAIAYVTQTRIYYLVFFIVCFITLWKYKQGNSRLLLIVLGLVGLPIIYYSFRELYQSLFTDENLWGTEIRQSGYQYFFSHMFDGVICGIGTVYNSPHVYLLTGKQNYGYVLSDMGYAGFIGVFGLCGVVCLVRLLFLFIRTHSALKQIKMQKIYPETVAIPVFFLIINISLSFADPQRCMYLPIILLVYYHIESQLIIRKLPVYEPV